MNTLKLYTVINQDGKFPFPTMGGSTIWSSYPDYRNAMQDRDQACGWKYNLGRDKKVDESFEVCELTISWE